MFQWSDFKTKQITFIIKIDGQHLNGLLKTMFLLNITESLKMI